LYFFQFIDQAVRHGLQFLGEADFFELQFHNYPPETVKLLEKMAATNIIIKEQYLDFLKGRRFRQTLLCHAGIDVNPVPDPRPLSKMFIASRARPVAAPVDFKAGNFVEFAGQRGAKVGTDYPLAKAALVHLGGIYPRPLAFSDLLNAARQLVGETDVPGSDDAAETLSEILVRIYGTGLLEFYTRGPDYVMEVSECPVASPFARLQVERGLMVANLRHANVEIEDHLGRELLKLLDGTRNRRSLLEDLTVAVRSSGALLKEDGTAVQDSQKIRSLLSGDLEANLQKLADLALLVA